MKRHLPLSWLALIAIFFIYSCDPVKNIPASDDGKIEFIILQTNDVYEISPLEGGTVGGMARVAQIKKELLAENPNTMAVMAGDFLNPSVIGTLKYEGERIRGKQMVETMNVAGIDLVTFGNHEFDLDENDLLQRIEESDLVGRFLTYCTIRMGNYRHFNTKARIYRLTGLKNLKMLMARVSRLVLLVCVSTPTTPTTFITKTHF